jgi:hypothetical protein
MRPAHFERGLDDQTGGPNEQARANHIELLSRCFRDRQGAGGTCREETRNFVATELLNRNLDRPLKDTSTEGSDE